MVAHLLREPWPQVHSIREAASVAKHSGDVIDVFACSGDRMAMLMADVSGRGLRTEAYANDVRDIVRALVHVRSPAMLLNYANMMFNRHLTGHGDHDLFASVFIASFDGCELRYASAGHDIALLFSGRRHRHLEPTGLLLGVDETERYGEITLEVEPGDQLVLATDGVTETRDLSGTFFGTRGLAHAAMAAIRAGVDDPASTILEAARQHGGGHFVDDASVLCVGFGEEKQKSIALCEFQDERLSPNM